MTGLELLAIWGIGQTATTFVKGVLSDVAKDFAKKNVSSLAGCLLNVEKLKAYGSAHASPPGERGKHYADLPQPGSPGFPRQRRLGQPFNGWCS